LAALNDDEHLNPSCVFKCPSIAHATTSNLGGWGGDNSNSPTATNPWFYRGGQANNGANAGVFAFNRNTGGTSNGIGWRAVLSGVWGSRVFVEQASGRRFGAEGGDEYDKSSSERCCFLGNRKIGRRPWS